RRKENRKEESGMPLRLSLRLCAFAGAILFLFTVCLFAQTPDTPAQLREYIETGRYTEAEAAAKKLLLKTPDNGAVRHELAETLALTGRYTEAITEFERAAAKADNAADKLESDLRRAEVLDLIGQEDRAKPIYETFVTYYTDHDPKTARELTLIARALVHLERYQDANDMYRSAIEADSNYLEAQLGAAELFTQKYAYGDAALFLDDAFKINPNSARVFLAVARNKRLDGDAETSAALTKALAINPNLV